MANHPPQPDAINRRTLLRLGTASALAVGAASAVEQPKTGTQFAAKPAPNSEAPNLHPPVRPGQRREAAGPERRESVHVPWHPVCGRGAVRNAEAGSGMGRHQGRAGLGAGLSHPAGDLRWHRRCSFPHRYWVENENCQVLNVWTQSLSSTAKKPVMVWMHGGGFTNGSSMESYAYDGKTLSEFGDVVAVSVNHGLNIIGTLDLSAYGPEYANSRYTGMADLVAALEWVRDNIEAFGGDPGNVTIFGQSGGGGKVTRLMQMPAAKGLFHRAINESGGSLNYRITEPAKSIEHQQAIAAATLKNLNLDGNQD